MARPVDEDFVSFVRSRQHSLLRVAHLACGDPTTAEDLVQEAFAKLASRWDAVREGSPDAYVRRIIFHDAVSGWRRWGRRQSVVDPAETGSPFDRPGHDALGTWVYGADVRAALAQLPARQRAVMVLRYYDDLTEAQIAETLGSAPGTVKTLARGALVNLRRLLPALAAATAAEGEEPR